MVFRDAEHGVACLERFHSCLAAGDVGGLVQCFAADGELVINGRKSDAIPFAGRYQGHVAIRGVLLEYFGAVEFVRVDRQYDLVDDVDPDNVKITTFYNVIGRARSTGTVFDLEFALLITMGEGSFQHCWWFYNTDVFRRAFDPREPSTLRDEKGTGIATVDNADGYDPKSLVRQIYSLIFEGAPRGVHVGPVRFLRTLASFVAHNITKSPTFWVRLIRDFDTVGLVRQAALCREYFSPYLVHMVKGGETEIKLCGTYYGLPGLSDFAVRLYSELEYEGIPPLLEVMGVGNRCVVRMPETFVNKATGIRAVVHMLHMWRFDSQGKVLEFKSYNDTFEMVQSYRGLHRYTAADSPAGDVVPR